MFKNFFIKNSLNVLLLRASGILLMFLLSLFLTNSFSAEIVGQYDFVRSFLMILSGASLLGTNQAIIYYSGILTSKKSFGSIRSIYFKMNFLILIACAILYTPLLVIDKETINQIFNKQGAYELVTLSLKGLVFYSITMLNIDTIRALKHTLISEWFRNVTNLNQGLDGLACKCWQFAVIVDQLETNDTVFSRINCCRNQCWFILFTVCFKQFI